MTHPDPNRGAGEAWPPRVTLTNHGKDEGMYFADGYSEPQWEYLSREESNHLQIAAADRARADGMKEARLWKKAAEEWMAAYDKLKQKYEPMHWVPSESAPDAKEAKDE